MSSSVDSAAPQILIDREDAIAIVTLNRPEKRNALSPEMIVRLARFWQEVSADPTIRVIVVTGAGDKAFCSGGDLGTLIPIMMKTREPQGEWEHALAKDRRQLGAALLRTDGFFMPRQVSWAHAAELLMLAEPVDAARALSMGLVNRVVPQAQVLATALDLARRMAQGAPVALEKTKEVMVRSSGLPLDQAFAIETQCTRENAATDDAREGPRAFMEKRPPVFTGRRPT